MCPSASFQFSYYGNVFSECTVFVLPSPIRSPPKLRDWFSWWEQKSYRLCSYQGLSVSFFFSFWLFYGMLPLLVDLEPGSICKPHRMTLLCDSKSMVGTLKQQAIRMLCWFLVRWKESSKMYSFTGVNYLWHNTNFTLVCEMFLLKHTTDISSSGSFPYVEVHQVMKWLVSWSRADSSCRR